MPVNDVLPSLPGSSAIPFFHIILFNFIVHMTPLNLNGIGSCRYIPVILLKFFYEKQLFRLFLKDVKRFYLINQTLQLFSGRPLPCYKLFYIPEIGRASCWERWLIVVGDVE